MFQENVLSSLPLLLQHVRLAKRFEKLIGADSRFEVANQVKLGLVCFRLKVCSFNKKNSKLTIEICLQASTDATNEKFLSSINASGKLHMVPASLNGKYVIRFCVCSQSASNADIDHAYRVISQFATDLFEIMDMKKKADREAKDTGEENEAEDEVFMLDRKRQMSLRYRRSFFVRMVSDPKLYNPKIVKALTTSSSSMDDKFNVGESNGSPSKSHS